MTNVEAAAIGPVAVGARLYRHRGERMLGVLVKAAYELRHHAAMTPLPAPTWRTRGNVAHPGDEPFPLRHAEIVIGPLPQVARAPGAVVSLAVRRGEGTILDVRRTAGEPGARDATVGFGPMTPGSPTRAALAAGLDPASLVGAAELALPDELDPTYFQAAPPAQRLDALRHGDVLVLLGMSPVARVLQTAIPAQRGAAVVQIGGDAPRRFALRLDRIHIAPDALVAELSYRFAVPVPDGAQAIRVAGGLDSASSPFAAPAVGAMAMSPVSVLADAPPAAVREERPPPTELFPSPGFAPPPLHGGTVVMGPSPAVGRPPAPSSPFESTVVASSDAPAPSSLPFHRVPGSVPPASPSSPIPGAPWAGEAAAHRPVPVAIGPDDAPPMTVFLGAGHPHGGHAEQPGPPEVDLELDLEVPTSAGGDSKQVAAPRPKADPWRKDGDLPAPPPVPSPPAAPKAGPTRPDLSAGLYKRFKR